MGKFDFRPARVLQTARRALGSPKLPNVPPWYDVVAEIPPAQMVVRTQPVQHSSQRRTTRKSSKLFKPQTISYPEDSLRKTFFSDHPWELARPRIVLENTGADYRGQEWSSIRPATSHLSGESVVQRQIWLMENKQLSRDEAYDEARREFYAERMREEIEQRVANEEATATGAYFGRTTLAIGNIAEDIQYEKFRTWANKTLDASQAAKSAVNPRNNAAPISDPGALSEALLSRANLGPAATTEVNSS